MKFLSTLTGGYIPWCPSPSWGCSPQPTLSDTLCQTTHSTGPLHTSPISAPHVKQLRCVDALLSLIRKQDSIHFGKSRLVNTLSIPLGTWTFSPKMRPPVAPSSHCLSWFWATSPPSTSPRGPLHAGPQRIARIGGSKGKEEKEQT